MAKMRIAVLFGGASSEHEISCLSASAVAGGLSPDKYDVIKIGITKKGRWLLYPGDTAHMADGTWYKSPDCVPAVLSPDAATRGLILNVNDRFDVQKIDMVFPVLHGKNGEDGTVQGLLEMAGLPYVGCGVASSALCMDKAFANSIFDLNNIPHTPWLSFTHKDLQQMDAVLNKINRTLQYPLFIKPASAGSSVGVSRADAPGELAQALKLASAHDIKIIAEQGVNGSEVECAVIGNSLYSAAVPVCSTPGEVVSCKDTLYDYEAKYLSGDASKTYIPARFSAEKLAEVQAMAVKAYQALDCCGLSRVDFFIRNDGQVLINEINTLPGFTSISMYAKLMAHDGTPFPALLDKLIDCAKERFNMDCL